MCLTPACPGAAPTSLLKSGEEQLDPNMSCWLLRGQNDSAWGGEQAS